MVLNLGLNGVLVLFRGVPNNAGYINAGIVPKYAGCQSEGVVWFQNRGLWQDGSYTPKARRYNLFRLGR